jgi:hypothetical protein
VDVLYLPLENAILGADPAVHVLWTLALAVAVSFLVYLALGRLGFERVHAFAVAALLLVFPFFDSTRLWATANLTQLAVALCVAGLLVALRGLSDARAPRGAIAHHAGALALYLLGIFTYEATAPFVALFGALYRVQAPWTRVARRWGADLGVVAVAVAWVWIESPRRPQSLAADLRHARAMADQAASVLADAARPFGYAGRLTTLAALGVLVGAALLLYRLLPPRDDARAALGRWVVTAAAGVVFAVAGWLMFVPAAAYYLPAGSGVINRTNAVASVGIVLTVYACVVLGVTLLFRGVARWRTLAGVAAGLVAVLLAAGYVRDVRRDVDVWTRAARRADGVLAALDRAVGRPPHGATLYVFGAPAFEAPGVPVFVAWDLAGAVQLRWDDASLRALAVTAGTSIECGATRVRPVIPVWGPMSSVSYRAVFFVGAGAARAIRIRTARDCRAASARFRRAQTVDGAASARPANGTGLALAGRLR